MYVLLGCDSDVTAIGLEVLHVRCVSEKRESFELKKVRGECPTDKQIL